MSGRRRVPSSATAHALHPHCIPLTANRVQLLKRCEHCAAAQAQPHAVVGRRHAAYIARVVVHPRSTAEQRGLRLGLKVWQKGGAAREW